MPRYARAGIPEAWLVDDGAKVITVYSQPGPDGYASEAVLKRGADIVSDSVAALHIPVDEIFD